MILSYDRFCFFQRGEPPLNFEMFVSSNAFDNSPLLLRVTLKFTWFGWVVIAIEVGGEIDAPSRDPSRFTTPLTSVLKLFRFHSFKLVMTVSALAISHSFSPPAKRNGGGPSLIKSMRGYPH